MTKKTLGIILNAFIVLLVIMIVMMIVMIGKRGARPIEAQDEAAQEAQEAQLSSGQASASDAGAADAAADGAAADEEPARVLYASPDTDTGLNVRAGAGTDYDKLGTAYAGEKYEVQAVQEGGWTRVDYRGSEGYMSNKYLLYFYEVTDADGNTQREDVALDDLERSE